VTVVAPRAKLLPEAGVQVAETVPSQPSRALAVKLTGAWPEPVHSAVKSEGTVTTGAVESTTVTVKLFMPVLPLPSLAVHVTVVVPNTKELPEAGLQLTETGPAQISLALALKLTGAWPEPVHSTEMGAGTVTAGGVESTTVTVKLFMPVLPLPSLAVHVTVVVPNTK